MDPRGAFAELEKRVAQDVVGQGALVRQVLIGLLANGHLLLERALRSHAPDAAESEPAEITLDANPLRT